MSDFEAQARIMHQTNVIRDTLKGLHEWQMDIKQKEAQHNESDSQEVNFK